MTMLTINGTKVPMSYRLTSFEGGSDHVLFADSYFGIPSLMFGHEDPYYHSSMDTVEYCDSTELKRVVGMGISISHILSVLDNNLIFELWPIIHQGIYNRWGKAIRLLEELILSITIPKDKSSKEDLIELVVLGTDIIQSFHDYELNLLKWVEKVNSSSKLVGLLEPAKKEISEILEIYSLRWSNQIKEYRGDKEIQQGTH